MPSETVAEAAVSGIPSVLTLPTRGDGKDDQPMCSDAVTGCLKALLAGTACMPADLVNSVGSHSLQATLLTALGKKGAALEDRQLLG